MRPSRRRAGSCRARRSQPPPQHPTQSASNHVPTARSMPDGTVSSLLAVRLQPSWRRSCKPDRACPGGQRSPSSTLHTCERKAHRPPKYLFSYQQLGIGPQRAFTAAMKNAWLGCLFLGGLLFAGTQDSDLNVNKRYTVDTVIVAGEGWRTNLSSDQTDKISPG